MALDLAREGAHIALCARNAQDLQAAEAEVREVARQAHGDAAGRVISGQLDVTDHDAVAAFLARTESELAPVDLLLINAGGPPAGNLADLDLDHWRQAYTLTVESAVQLCRLVLPGMMDRGFGRIVSITSVSVLQPVENLLLSSVLRPAVQALTKSLALEAAPHGVTINAVAPGFHNTSAVQRLIQKKVQDMGCSPEDVVAGWTGEIAAGRPGRARGTGRPHRLPHVRAGELHHGQGIVSDGGWVKGTF